MPGKILIIDSVATNRIVLKVKLTDAFYKVAKACDYEEAIGEIHADQTDLIIVGCATSSGSDGIATCQKLKENPMTAPIPILVLCPEPKRAFRLEALKVGAEDVLEKPVEDAALLARIRALLRARDTEEEWQVRDKASGMLGFAEHPAQMFEPRSKILLATPNKISGLNWRTRLKPIVPYAMTHKPLNEVLQEMTKIAPPDAFVISLNDKDPEEGLRLLAEIRARPNTRHAAVLVVLSPHGAQHMVDALDLGANDVMIHGFDPEEMALRLSTIIKSKRFRDGLRQNVRDGLEAAVTDPLTGLFNRRYALPHLRKIAEISRRSSRDYAVMVADLDHFKAVNDRYGHAAGDAVLAAVAQRLRGALRPVDLLARIGGEEFLIALPATDRKGASVVADKLCHAIGSQPVRLKKRDLQIPVTISIGVAMASDHQHPTMADQEETTLLDGADRALYGAKATGRNQVTLETQHSSGWGT